MAKASKPFCRQNKGEKKTLYIFSQHVILSWHAMTKMQFVIP
jgi:hypothetical protein